MVEQGASPIGDTVGKVSHLRNKEHFFLGPKGAVRTAIAGATRPETVELGLV
jgi:hypothetical protein